MKMPSKEDAQSWFDIAEDLLLRKNAQIEKDPFESGHYVALGDCFASKARAQYLRGDSHADVRASFKQAAESVEVSFIMAYDPNDSRYIGNTARLEYADVNEGKGLNMMIWALLAHDFDLARRLAGWVRTPARGTSGTRVANNFIFALKYTLLDDWARADGLVADTFRRYPDGEPKKPGYQRNFYTLTWALAGILRRDDKLLNDGLARQLNDYRSEAEGEAKDTDEEYICDNAVALAILGRNHGRRITVQDDYFPTDLI